MALCQENILPRADRAKEINLLEVRDMTIHFSSSKGIIQAVREVSFALGPGEILAVVGESGSGKSVAGKALLGLIESPGVLVEGKVLLNGKNIFQSSEEERRKLRGTYLSMIFQDPGTAFDPVFTVGSQMVESILVHKQFDRCEAVKETLENLVSVGFTNPQRIFNSYPFELSGGMKQRVYIAMAMSLSPKIIVADEPTTALDMVSQYRVLSLLKKIQSKSKCSVILITHDLDVVAGFADKVMVMYAGQVVEMGLAADVIQSPRHPYTQGLINSSYRNPSKDRLAVINGQPPAMDNLPWGCSFSPRCNQAADICSKESPPLHRLGKIMYCRCFRPLQPEPQRKSGEVY